MITPFLDSVYNRVRALVVSFGLRKWRYLRLFTNKPALFKTRGTLVKGIETYFYNASHEKNISLSIKEYAEHSMRNEVSVLGSGWMKFEEIPWDLDIKSGFKWPSGKYYYSYKTIDYTNNADVKVPWEISRCHDLVALGLVYQDTRDEKYANKIKERIEDWINKNPWMYSINWTCSMDVAIRAVNWMWAIYLIRESNAITDSFASQFSKSLYEHGFFIYNNIENGEQFNGNHLISDLVGLVYIGSFLKGNKKADKWFKYAKDALYNEIRTQFLPSGFHYERSLAYHNLVTEMVSHAISQLKNADEIIPLDIERRVNLMQDALGKVKKEDGSFPNIADNDDGHFLPFLDVPKFDVNEVKKDLTDVFQDAGFAIRKTEKYYLFVSNSGISKYPEKGRFNTSHTHCDLLSFILSIKGTDFIIDPGTCNYTGNIAKRDEYRSTRKHNTVQIDDIEQFKYESTRPFQMYDDVNIEPLKQKDIVVSGSYELKRQGCCLQHKRSFVCRDAAVEIKDEIECQGKHEVSLFFHLDPNVQFAEQQGGYMLRAKGKTVEIKTDGKLKGSFMADTMSKSYGTEVNAQTIILRGQFEDSVQLTTIFEIQN